MEATLTRYLQINSADLVYLKFILEAYEGFATMSTEDGKNGIIRIVTPASFHEEVNDLLNGLRGEVAFAEVLRAPSGTDTATGWIRKEQGHA